MPAATRCQPIAESHTDGRSLVHRLLRPTSTAVVWAWLVAMAAVRAGSPDERDPYWETRAGIENLQGLALARPDTWSWAPVDGDWYQNSPGWNYLLALSWQGGGYWGLFLFGFVALLTFFGLSYIVARKLGAHPLGALAGITAGFIWAFPMVSSRGTTGVQILLLLGLLIPTWWRRLIGRLSTWLNAAALTAIGAGLAGIGNWLHLSFLAVGPLIAASWGVYWLLSDWPGDWRIRLRDRRRWAVTLGGGFGIALGTLSSPYGVVATIVRTRATQEACGSVILEWVSPFNPGILHQWPMVIQWPPAALLTVAAVLALCRWWLRTFRRGELDARFALVSANGVLVLPMAIAGMFALRFLGTAILLFVPIVGMGATLVARRARTAAALMTDTARFKDSAVRWTQAGPWRNVLALVFLLLLPFSVLLGPMAHAVPPELAAIESLPSGCRLFTSGAIAGPTILARPDVLVWYDGRGDFYGRQRLDDANAYRLGVAEAAAPPGATCVILPIPSGKDALPGATARMNADPHWWWNGAYGGFDVWLRVS
jgi:hypothetical protein